MSVPSSFNVSATSGVLGSWLANTTTSANAATLLGGTTTSNGGGALAALLNKSSSTTPSTALALDGLIKPSQQRVISAIGSSTGPLSIPWNSNGTEPTTVAALRTAGWIKLDKKILTNGKPSGATYELTKLGVQVNNRTGGGRVGATTKTALTSKDTNGTPASTSSTAALQSTVSSITSILGSVGVSV